MHKVRPVPDGHIPQSGTGERIMEDAGRYAFSHLNWVDLERLKQDERFVLLLPVGATESHGPHCPIGTDSIIAEAVSTGVAERLHQAGYLAYVLPPVTYTVALCARGFPGTISVSEETECRLLKEIFLQLIHHGMTRICVVNNHGEPGNVRAIYDAIQSVHEETGVQVLFPNKLRKRFVKRLSEAFKRGETHADQYETSLIQAIAPALVHEERRKQLAYLPVNLAEKMFQEGLDEFTQMGMEQGYCGDPASATPQEGFETLEVLIQITVESLMEMFQGRIPDEGRGLYGSRKES